jgi:glyoxylase-like metal-dependent hydrolase (beta-lactamase superfamily II)
MPAATLAVGDVEITAILDVDTSMPLTEVFDGSGDPPPGGSESLAATYPDEFTADSWRFRDHCFLVRIGTRLTLIDTGVGPADSAFGRWLGVTGTLPDELAALGVMPDDVDDVILTHVHSDHTGWNTAPSSSGWVPRFSNARYHLHDADVAWMRGFVDEEDVREFAEAIAPPRVSGTARHVHRGPRVVARLEPATRAGSHPRTPVRSPRHRRRAGSLRRGPRALHLPAERPRVPLTRRR